MNVNDFVILPGSKAGTSMRLKTKTVKELQLEKAQLETENKEMEKRLWQLQSNMSREKEERRKLGAYHWKSGQAAPPRTTQAQVVAQYNENRKKISPEKVKLRILKDQIQEPVKKPVKPERTNVVAHEKLGVKGMACGPPKIKGGLLEPASEPACTNLGKQDKGLLLSGAFDEEVSAKSFQDALLQWRKGKSDPGGDPCASGVPSEPVGDCEVQTNVTALKEPIHVEFQKDGLSYMEKLLLKKYRRTPVDQFFASSMEDSRPVQALSVHQAGAGGGGQGEDDDDDGIEELTEEEVKKYWASVYRVEESNIVSENAESSLKIEFLDDSPTKDLEESSHYSVEETGDVGMSKQGETDPLECGSNPVSTKEISQEKPIVCSDLEINAVQEESIEPKAGGTSLSSCELPEEVSDLTEAMSKDLLGTELKSSRDLLETEVQKSRREPQELGSACSSQSLVLPVTTKSSALQDVAKRQKCASTSYQGLEGFFVVGANPKQEKLEAPSSLAAASSPGDRRIPFPGDGQWASGRSLSEYADDSVVQGVLESHMNRAANAVQAPRNISPLMAAWTPWPGPEDNSNLTCEDETSSSRAWEKIFGNADFQNTLELKDHDTFDIFGDWEESQMDSEEAILEDKQQVLALQ
ncbi:zinc finger B-box domain-containing protein 1 [Oenanthe melanoleuca]|uniref:zinc finger B-box domain-containing protein 1 n=1 Tax=Oenanthe melanoleuca TaxID=2939378 RepID=UPI0024C0E975|nr:zinc finger B-box domain-containing protein 1 [Oenanthe melanoleuca]XP_056355281.1 zinc finger B-box domain-containing protein 1 [Oenanthe melanoleuca]XP_056355282.1 zinc finger B-box domain-containing protein 1 [Oenanthe melanoleuca]XP_056355283.1 zinc finger B-box domain-containing protein 1 [Oenanthe melanoleuca]XP_056355284.1 zinc finger B-box domain-containing protein 1 [Oenanthe melanoleuca]XP_056355285.1 zinc finger B-box domain-containing protein 1 [Oenanthe melanoleuca]XP_05635528